MIFDEFHERGGTADLSLALLREAKDSANPDLAVILMSATLDLSDLRERLPDAESAGKPGPLLPGGHDHQPPRPDEPLPNSRCCAPSSNTPSTNRRAAGVLVFLPGLAEIERCRQILTAAPSLQNWKIQALHGQLPLQQQSSTCCSAATGNQDGSIILASAIAESSLTIDGVRLVIDSGLSRHTALRPQHPHGGLETTVSSLASAEQRRGRAGRQCPGRCIRLWSPAEQQRRPQQDPLNCCWLIPSPC